MMNASLNEWMNVQSDLEPLYKDTPIHPTYMNELMNALTNSNRGYRGMGPVYDIDEMV